MSAATLRTNGNGVAIPSIPHPGLTVQIQMLPETSAKTQENRQLQNVKVAFNLANNGLGDATRLRKACAS